MAVNIVTIVEPNRDQCTLFRIRLAANRQSRWLIPRPKPNRTRQVCPFYSVLEMFCLFVLDISRPAETDVRHTRLVPARGAPAVFVRSLRSHTYDRFGRIAQARAVDFRCYF